MSQLQIAAERINRKVHGKRTGYQQEVAIDPDSIMMVVEILQQLIAAFKNCRSSSSQAAYRANSSGRLEERHVRKAVKAKMGWWGWWWNRAKGEELVSAILDYGKEITQSEAAALYSEDEKMVLRT